MTRARTAFALSAVLAAVSATGGRLAAQDDEQAERVRLRAEKTAAVVFQRADWTFDYDEARRRARQQGKVIFCYFTRSYAACGPCTRLESGPFSEPAFAEFGERVVLFCHISSKVEGEPYPRLLREKGGRGFPHLVFLDADGDVIATQRERTVASFRQTHGACLRFRALQERLAAGDTTVRPDLLIARIEMRGITFEKAERALAELGEVPAGKRARLAALMLNLEVRDARRQARTPKQAVAAGERFRKMWDAGRVPTGDAASSFFFLIMEAAFANGDAATYARALRSYERVAPPSKYREKILDRMRRRLKQLERTDQSSIALASTATPAMSSAEQPRDRSSHGRASPCSSGP